jgi:acyl dehydratase
MGINYGLNRVRFMAPVRVGSRLRGRFKLLSFEPLPGGAQLVVEATMELEGDRQAGLRGRIGVAALPPEAAPA